MPTRIKGSGILTLAAGAKERIRAEFAHSAEKHQQFIVANDSSTDSEYMIYLLGDDAKEAVPIPPQQAITIEGDAEFYIQAAIGNGGDASYTICQVFGGRITVDS